MGSLLTGLARCRSNVLWTRTKGGGARAGPVRTDTAGPKELRRGEHWCGGEAWKSPLLPGDARPQTKRLWSEKEKLDLLVHMP